MPERADLALVTVKAYDTATVAADLADCTLDAVFRYDGMGNDALAAVLESVLAGTCSYGARLREPGTVAFTGRGEVVWESATAVSLRSLTASGLPSARPVSRRPSQRTCRPASGRNSRSTPASTP